MTSLHLSDRALMERIAAGDEVAREALGERHRLPLYARVYAVLGDPRASEDLVCDVLARAWEAAPRFNPEAGSVAAWLTAISQELLERRRGPTGGRGGDGVATRTSVA